MGSKTISCWDTSGNYRCVRGGTLAYSLNYGTSTGTVPTYLTPSSYSKSVTAVTTLSDSAVTTLTIGWTDPSMGCYMAGSARYTNKDGSQADVIKWMEYTKIGDHTIMLYIGFTNSYYTPSSSSSVNWKLYYHIRTEGGDTLESTSYISGSGYQQGAGRTVFSTTYVGNIVVVCERIELKYVTSTTSGSSKEHTVQLGVSPNSITVDCTSWDNGKKVTFVVSSAYS